MRALLLLTRLALLILLLAVLLGLIVALLLPVLAGLLLLLAIGLVLVVLVLVHGGFLPGEGRTLKRGDALSAPSFMSAPPLHNDDTAQWFHGSGDIFRHPEALVMICFY